MDDRTGVTPPTPAPDSQHDHTGSQPVPRAPYRRAVPHVTQEPIDDVEPEFVTRERYMTLEQARSNRKHMGVASNDPDYLTPVKGARGTSRSPMPQHAPAQAQPKPSLHYDRYLETPKPGKSIFTSRRERKQRRIHRLLALALIVVIIALIIFLVCHFGTGSK